ncbi:hypothetical protein KJ885_04585 [Patescibacteria group bacterium]|nr:hypothetical protein [Patescibacteria group bacterium]
MAIEGACDKLFALICDRTNKTKAVGIGMNDAGEEIIDVVVEFGDRKIVEDLLDKEGKFKGFEVRIEEGGPIVVA